MYAIVRKNTFDQRKLDESSRQIAAFQRLHASQEGYAGSFTVDLGDGTNITVNLWDSEEGASRALSVLEAEVRRVLKPLMSAPSQVLGVGPASTDVAGERR
jgi:hypothetical protein